MRGLLVAIGLLVMWALPARTEIRLLDESDRAAFRAWFVLLADAQFYRPTPDVTDCASLVRHAVREALRPHTPEWMRRAALPLPVSYPDVRRPPAATAEGWPLFRVSETTYAEFADAETLVRLNTTAIGRHADAARPGDLFYFRQPDSHLPDHLMVFVGPSVFDRSATDWLVYHTGPDTISRGEVRKVQLHDLMRHPSPRWRPASANVCFVGIFRLALS